MNKQCVNYPGSTDHTTAECPVMCEQMKMDADKLGDAVDAAIRTASSMGHAVSVSVAAEMMKSAMASLPVGVPDGWKLVKIGAGCVTSDMKAKCIGEFSFGVIMSCAECVDAGVDADCPVCGGQIEYTQSIDVPWDVCKEIYKAMLAAAPTIKAWQTECGCCGRSDRCDDDCDTRQAPSLPAAGSAGEEPTVVAFLMRPDMYDSYVSLSRDSHCNGTVDALMTVAQYERIVAKLRDDLDECHGERWRLRTKVQRLEALSAQQSAPERVRDAALDALERAIEALRHRATFSDEDFLQLRALLASHGRGEV